MKFCHYFAHVFITVLCGGARTRLGGGVHLGVPTPIRLGVVRLGVPCFLSMVLGCLPALFGVCFLSYVCIYFYTQIFDNGKLPNYVVIYCCFLGMEWGGWRGASGGTVSNTFGYGAPG